MKQIRITTESGDTTYLLAKGAVPALASGELTVALHDGQTLRTPIASVLGYVVEDARKPTKLDALARAHEEACEAVETAASAVFAAVVDARLRNETAADPAFRVALADYVHTCAARDEATEALKAGAKAAKRAKDAAVNRKAAMANGTAPAPKAKKPGKKATKKVKE